MIEDTQKENENLLEFFEEYYSGYSVYSPKNRVAGIELSYGDYLKLQQQYQALYKLFLKTFHWDSFGNKKILDVGCGNGRALRQCIEWGAQPENLYGIDASETIIQEAQHLSAPAIRFQQGLGTQIPANDHFFDLILNFGVIIHIMNDENIRLLSRELFRTINKNGFLIVTATNRLGDYAAEWMKKRVRTFDHETREVEQLFSEWDCLHRQTDLQEDMGFLIDWIAEYAAEGRDQTTMKNRLSTDLFLMEQNVDLDLLKFAQQNQIGTLTLYVFKPKKH